MTHRAVLAGVNDYSGQASLPPGWSVGNLSKSAADVNAMSTLLTNSFGAAVDASLIDGAASRDAILDAIRSMLASGEAGDVATFFFSGHGGRFPDASDPSKYYECFIPASGAPITDEDIRSVADVLEPSYVNFTLILDSCYSGGIHEGTPDAPIKSASYSDDYIQACVANMTTIVPCGAAADSNDFVGNVSNVHGDGNGVVCSIDDDKSLVASSKTCLIAACRYDETAQEGPTNSVLTQGILDVVGASGAQQSYLTLIDALRSDVQGTLNAAQTPTLLGQENRMGEDFLAGWTSSKPGEFEPAS